MLEDREAHTVADWLRAHPGVEIIARDRSGAYADGARQGAPSAIQVADRFHLVQNASAALDDLLRGRRQVIDYARGPGPPPDPAAAVRPPSPSALRQQARRAARLARFEHARALHAAGVPKLRIARELGLSRKTIRRWIAASAPPQGHVAPEELARPRPGGLSSPTLQPHLAYLQDRWQQGCTNASQLYRELVDRGYAGSYSLVRAEVRKWRPPRPPRAPPGSRSRRRARRRSRSVRWLCLRPREQLRPEEQEALDQLLADDPAVARGYGLLGRFRTRVRGREVDQLDDWLADARASELPAFMALANGILIDRPAVEAALSLPGPPDR